MTLPTEQKSLAALKPKGDYTVFTTRIPQPGPGEVLVKVKGAALNHIEWKLPYSPVEVFPYPLHSGTDGAGVVIQVGGDEKGEGEGRVKKGDRIMFQGYFDSERSSFQEYAVVDANLCAKIPDKFDFLQAASIPAALIAASFGLCLPPAATPSPTKAAKTLRFPPRGGVGLKPYWEDEAEGTYAGQSIVVLGGASSVGQYAIQIAKYLGFGSIITTASQKHAEHLTSLGATLVIDRSGPFSSLSLHQNVKVVFDAIGANVTQDHIDILVPNGKFVSVGQAISPSLKFEDGRQGVLIFGAAHYYSDAGKGLFGRLEGFLTAGVLKPLNIEKLEGGLDAIPEGLKRLKEGRASGVKLVVDPSRAGAGGTEAKDGCCVAQRLFGGKS